MVKDALEMGERLKKQFSETAHILPFEEDYYRLKKIGIECLIEGHYYRARDSFISALDKTDDFDNKIFLYSKIVEATKESFMKKPDELALKRVCEAYEGLISLDETPENYVDYVRFIGWEIFKIHTINLAAEAEKVGVFALQRFPEDPVLQAEMHSLYSLLGKKEEAYNCLVMACKLEYDDPEFLIRGFGLELFNRHPSINDPKTIPIQIVFGHKDKKVWNNEFLVTDYADTICKYLSGYEGFALNLFIRASDLDPDSGYFRDKVFESYHRAVEEADANKLIKVKNLMRVYCKEHNIDTSNLTTLDDGLIDENPKEEFDCVTIKETPKTQEKQPSTAIVKQATPLEIKVLTSIEIKAQLDEYVVGQEEAKIDVAIGLHRHLLCLERKLRLGVYDDVEKSNILFVGPTACGKTQLAKATAMILEQSCGIKIPFIVTDAAQVTEAGYIGEHPFDFIRSLYFLTGKDIVKTEMGMIFVDEIDKKRRDKSEISKDVSGEGAQQQFLKILEGSVVEIDISGGKSVSIDTRHILFMAAGVFPGLEEVLRKKKGSNMGFKLGGHVSGEDILRELTDEDLIEYGFLSEFIGRFQTINTLDKLTEEELRRVLVEPKDAIWPQYINLFAMDGIALEMTGDAMDLVANAAYNSKSGARSLKRFCNLVLRDASFRLPGTTQDSLKVDEAYARKRLKKFLK